MKIKRVDEQHGEVTVQANQVRAVKTQILYSAFHNNNPPLTCLGGRFEFSRASPGGGKFGLPNPLYLIPPAPASFYVVFFDSGKMTFLGVYDMYLLMFGHI